VLGLWVRRWYKPHKVCGALPEWPAATFLASKRHRPSTSTTRTRLFCLVTAAGVRERQYSTAHLGDTRTRDLSITSPTFYRSSHSEKRVNWLLHYLRYIRACQSSASSSPKRRCSASTSVQRRTITRLSHDRPARPLVGVRAAQQLAASVLSWQPVHGYRVRRASSNQWRCTAAANRRKTQDTKMADVTVDVGTGNNILRVRRQGEHVERLM